MILIKQRDNNMLPEIIKNITYTELVHDRVNKKLGTDLNHQEIENWVQITLHKPDCKIQRKGKNYYITSKSQYVRLTINASNYRLITVNRIDI